MQSRGGHTLEKKWPDHLPPHRLALRRLHYDVIGGRISRGSTEQEPAAILLFARFIKPQARYWMNGPGLC